MDFNDFMIAFKKNAKKVKNLAQARKKKAAKKVIKLVAKRKALNQMQRKQTKKRILRKNNTRDKSAKEVSYL